MARIRTIKPEFFRHSALFDAEQQTGLPLRVAFAGLWTVADREGRFRWKPREIKLDILPYDDVDISRVLDALTTRGFIRKYACEGVEYGWIPSWKRHQVINNRESESCLPECPQVLMIEAPIDACPTRAPRDTDLHVHAIGEGEGKGKGKEEEKKENTTPKKRAPKAQALAGVPAIGNTDLYHAVEQAFLSRNGGKFTDYGKEGKSIKGLIQKASARSPGEEGAMLKEMVSKFWSLRCNGDKFWKGQPFLPSTLNASGIWDRVLETMRTAETTVDPIAMAVAGGRNDI